MNFRNPWAVRLHRCAAALAACGIVGTTAARVDQATVACGEGTQLCLWEKPVIAAAHGWALDAPWSQRLRISIYTPVGSNFVDAPANMMARAVERPPGLLLGEFMQTEQDRLIGPSLAVSAEPVAPLRNADGRNMPAIRIAPREGRAGGVQTVVFGEDGKHFIVLTLNARSYAEHERAWPGFVEFVAGYRREPASASAAAR